MPPTKRDALNAYSSARAQVEEWKARFLQEWNAPIAEDLAIAVWNKMSKAQQELFKRQKPDEYKHLTEMIKRIQVEGGRDGTNRKRN